MNLDKLRLWVDDLRTTKDPQTQGCLTRDDSARKGDCCLGRLCKVAIADGLPVRVRVGRDGRLFYDGANGAPPRSVLEWLGAPELEYVQLAEMNDNDCLSFAEIGDYLATTYGLETT